MTELYRYQEEGRDFLAKSSVAFLADEPGLGKTGQSIRAALAWQKATGRKVLLLVICPTSAIAHWKSEKVKWSEGLGALKMSIATYGTLSRAKTPALMKHRVQAMLALAKYNDSKMDILLIADEAHRLKNPAAICTRRFYEVLHGLASATWLLSGTPSKNHNGELYVPLKRLRPDLIVARGGSAMSLEQFEDEYCLVTLGSTGHRVIIGSKNTDVLRRKLAGSGFLLRRRKSQVQADMPKLTVVSYPLHFTRNQAAEARAFLGKIGVKTTAAQTGTSRRDSLGDTDDPDEVMAMLRKHAVNIHQERRMLGMLKLPKIIELVIMEMETPGKLVIFAHHKDVILSLHEALKEYQPVLLHGGTSRKSRDAAVEQFKMDANCRIFVGQIQACGEAISLTEASQVLMAEASWSPSDNYQAICRVHRHGQKNPVLARFCAVPKSVDETIQKALARKTRDFSALFD